VKGIACLLAVLFGTCAHGYAQSGATGTWSVPQVVPSPPTLVLRADGPALTGSVRVGGTREIVDGRIDGDTITFKVIRPAGDLTMIFTGRIAGDEITFTREMHRQAGATTPPNPILKLESFPPSFTARRVREADLSDQDREQIEFTDQIRGVEVAAAVNFVQQDFKVVGTLFIPQKTDRVRALIVVVHYGLGQTFSWDPQIRKVAEATGSGVLLVAFPSIATPVRGTPRAPAQGGADGLLLLLQRLSQETGRPELIDAPMLFWGHSTAGFVGAGFAALHPQRTIGFVRYNSGPVTGADATVLREVPALLLTAGHDAPATIDAAETLWKTGRSMGAPWTLAMLPDAAHGSEEDLKSASPVMLSWMTAVIRQRTSPGGGALRPVADPAWLGDLRTREVAPETTFGGSKLDATWLPDEATARAWRVAVGPAK
jgi:hypothetical protein